MPDIAVLTSLAPHWLADIDIRDALLVLLTPMFLSVVAIEWLKLGHRRGADHQAIYELRDSMDSITLGSVYSVLDVLIVVLAILPAMTWAYQFRLSTIEITPLSFAALYMGVEFCYYWFHRASHRIRWFWCAHVVHHASEHMNFTTAFRQSWLYSFAGNWLFYVPMVLLGFEPRWVLFALSINLAYQFFVHTQWIDKLPAPIEFIFNTPSHHRAHHGRNPRYIDKNYGGTLIVFDRLFGTFVEETETVDYGLVNQVHSHNPIWLTMHEWVALFRDILKPGPLRLRVKHLWGPPEWERSNDNAAHAPQRSSRPHRTARP
jgi:sterol desaturase/sphingolipid hydroxylase (fatty acid hydroxylase superfamily)